MNPEKVIWSAAVFWAVAILVGLVIPFVRGELAKPDPFDFDDSDTQPMEDSKP